MSWKRGRAAGWWFVLLAACSSGAEPPAPAKSSLSGSAIARVGRGLVTGSTVADIARAQNLEPRQAAAHAIEDALWAAGAEDEIPPATVRSIERAALARALITGLRRTAEAMGPPSDAEIEGIVKERWVELNRPNGARTTHAVVINQDPNRDAAARAVAEKLAASLRAVASGSELLSRAREFPNEGFEIRAESLPFVTSDGRTFEKRGERFVDARQDFDVAFALAANALERPGQLSPVVKSKYGYHVIRLEERAPSSIAPKAELPELLAPEVYATRAKRARSDLLERLRQQGGVQTVRAADELTSKVVVR